MSTSKILVTGGRGTLGSLVVDRLRTIGCNVQILSHSERFSTVQGDLLTGEGLEQAVKGVDVIIHCAFSPIFVDIIACNGLTLVWFRVA